MSEGRERYLAHLQQLLPPGAAWPRDRDAILTKLLLALAVELSGVENRARALMEECDPRTALELLSEWEAWAGLPDPCMKDSVATLSERRRVLWQKLTGNRGLMLDIFVQTARMLGYELDILPHGRPFICGVSRCGHRLGGDHAARLVWRVIIKGYRLRDFRCGVSRCGDSLGRKVRADDMECILRRMNPAHLDLIIGYEG